MEEPKSPPASSDAKPPRLAALDAFRGLTILLMLLVNNVNLDTATPKSLMHAEWSGRVYFADVVFPWFLLAVGVAIPFAVASHRKRSEGWLSYYGKAFRRTVSLVVLGIIVDSTVNHAFTPGLGVLQVIGLAYFVAALLSPLATRWRLLIAAIFLVGHSVILLAWNVPGFGPGRFTESENAVVWLNEIHLAPWGLKGLVSVIPTAAMVLIGTAFGDMFRRSDLPVLRRAAVCVVIGGLLTIFGVAMSKTLPMNKPLWTASYIIYTAGLGAILIAVLHVLVDGNKYGKKLAFPFLVPGSNAITAYVAPILIKINVLQGWSVATDAGRMSLEAALQNACYHLAGRVNGGWLYTFGYIAVWWLVLFYFYKKQWLLRV